MGQKTLDSITIYLNSQSKQELEDEARRKSVSVSNLIRLKIGLPELKVGRKKSDVYTNKNMNSDDSEVVLLTETVPLAHYYNKAVQLDLFDNLKTDF